MREASDSEAVESRKGGLQNIVMRGKWRDGEGSHVTQFILAYKQGENERTNDTRMTRSDSPNIKGYCIILAALEG